MIPPTQAALEENAKCACEDRHWIAIHKSKAYPSGVKQDIASTAHFQFSPLVLFLFDMVLWLCQPKLMLHHSVLLNNYIGALSVQQHNCANLFVLFPPTP